MFGYVVPAADEVLLVSGGKVKEGDHPFAIERGSKFLGFSFKRKWTRLSLAQRMATVEEPCITTQGITVNLKAKVYFKVPRTDEAIYAAGERFRGDDEQKMQNQVGQVFAVHLRSIVGSMTVQEIIRDRQKLADEVLAASKVEVANMGLAIDSFGISEMTENSGFITALRAPFEAKAQQDAAIAQSQANQAAAEAEQESQRAQAKTQRDTLIAKAQYQAEVDAERKKSEQAGPLAEAQAQDAVLEQQEKIARRNAELRQAQLESEVIKPAQAQATQAKINADANAAVARTNAEAAASVAKINAEAQAQVTEVNTAANANNIRLEGAAKAETRVLMADAEAHALQANAEALAANDQVNLQRLLIENLPQIVESASKTLDGATVTVLNGAEGVNEIITNGLSQGLAIFDMLRKNVAGLNKGESLNVNEQDLKKATASA